MATTLDHSPESAPIVRKGHGTAALGPSDSSDTGSDIQGGPGADIGDANLDSDSDRNGTGERAAVGRDAALPVDVELRDDDDRVVDGESLNNASSRTSAADGEVAGHGGGEHADDEADADRDVAGTRPPPAARA